MAHRLTAELLGKLLKAEPEVMRLASTRLQSPDADVNSDEPPQELHEAAAVLESDAEILRFLASMDWTALDFLITLRATVQTALMADLIDSGRRTEPTSDIERANIQLWRNPPAELVLPLAEWKRTQIDPSLKTLRETENE